MTYNHATFIEEALNGFSKQETDFPYVAVIVDDASSDGNQHVILNYLFKNFRTKEDGISWTKEDDYAHYYYARHKNNFNCFFAVLLLKNNQCGKPSKVEHIKEWEKDSKYVAICEGDDFWTSPQKLQKQVDFLDNHSDFSICYHSVNLLYQKDQRITADDHGDVPSETTIYDLAKGNYIHTLSVVFRNNPQVQDELAQIGRVITGDYVLHMLNAKYGKIKKIPDYMGVYRLNENSIWGLKGDRERLPLWNEMLIKILPFFDEDVRIILYKQYLNICDQMFLSGEKKVYASHAYRLGKAILKPITWFKRIIKR